MQQGGNIKISLHLIIHRRKRKSFFFLDKKNEAQSILIASFRRGGSPSYSVHLIFFLKCTVTMTSPKEKKGLNFRVTFFSKKNWIFLNWSMFKFNFIFFNNLIAIFAETKLPFFCSGADVAKKLQLKCKKNFKLN